ncbi:MAG: hypothetical protein BAJALOKI2v1_880013 [Promethearchaeota archaeon]|nr:MAG: hypothetical protein BAJALOKI2v1_880013 [Candidatus Lokiarchaeota archaeon]
MDSQRSLHVLKLGGHEDSTLQIVASYPRVEISEEEAKNLILKCFPLGSKEGDYYSEKYQKSKVLSYIFKIKKEGERDDLFSISLMIDKKANEELYEQILKYVIDTLDTDNYLTEEILINNQEQIFEGISNEADITIDELNIGLSDMFKKLRKELNTDQNRKIKGSFF